MRAFIGALFRPLLCAKCGKQLHECMCEEIGARALSFFGARG